MPVQSQVKFFTTQVFSLDTEEKKKAKLRPTEIWSNSYQTDFLEELYTWSMKRYLFDVWIKNFACSLEGMIPSHKDICKMAFQEAEQHIWHNKILKKAKCNITCNDTAIWDSEWHEILNSVNKIWSYYLNNGNSRFTNDQPHYYHGFFLIYCYKKELPILLKCLYFKW
jgi:hypothetical protein